MKFLHGLTQLNDQAFKKERQELYEDWIIEIDKALRILSTLVADLGDSIEQQFQERQFRHLIANFHFEAVREVMDERREMLAHATAGACANTMSLGRRARLERTLRELDPDDVRALFGLSQVVGRYDLEGKDYRDTEQLRHHALSLVPNADSLIASGAIRVGIHAGFGGSTPWCLVTQLGHDILFLLSTFVRDRGAMFPVPGRQIRDGERDEQDARQVLSSIKGLEQLFSLLPTVSRIGKQYVAPVCRAPDEVSQTPHVLINVFGQEHRSSFEDLEKSFAGTELHCRVETGSQEYFRVLVYGPHDLLRVIADDLDAHWC